MLHSHGHRIPVLHPGMHPLAKRLLGMALAFLACWALAAALLAAGPLAFLPQRIGGPARAEIVNAVQRYASEWQPAIDPLVSIDDGLEVKSSNVYGVEVEGTRYYYRLTRTFSYDPVSRGEASHPIIVAVLDPGTQWETEVYRLD